MSSQLAKRVLLLGWDAADWKFIQPLMDAGEMPHLSRLVNNGVMGNLRTLQPILSPMLWSSIATGKRADKHGIYGFIEPEPDGSGVRPVASTSLRVQPLWRILEQQDVKSAVVGWFASHPADALPGTVISNRFAQPVGKDFDDWPLAPRSVSPAALEETFHDLRVHPSDIGPEELTPFIPGLNNIDFDKDKRPETLANLLAKCSTVHAAGTWLAEHGDWNLLAVYHDAIDLTGHDFMEFHPPKMAHVDNTDFELYKDVMTTMYRFHDLMLGRYMRLVGPETTIMIVSDHGFFSDHLRPTVSAHTQTGQPLEWHRDHGIFVMHGPGVRKDELVFGAGLLDITPTVLNLLGLPVGRDMEGQVLQQCFEKPPATRWVDSYEQKGAGVEVADSPDDDPWMAREILQQLIDLGYIDEIPEDVDKAIEQATAGKLLNLSQVYISTGRFSEAASCLEELLEMQPNNRDARMRLTNCRLQAGDSEAAQELADEILADNPDSARAHLVLGQIYFASGDNEAALSHYKKAESLTGPERVQLNFLLAEVHRLEKRWPDAVRFYLMVLDIDENNATSWEGLGIAYYRQERFTEAIEVLLRAVSLNFERATAHFYLGAALAATGDLTAAETSLQQALRIRPQMPAAHKLLARIYHDTDQAEKALLHGSYAKAGIEKRRSAPG